MKGTLTLGALIFTLFASPSILLSQTVTCNGSDPDPCNGVAVTGWSYLAEVDLATETTTPESYFTLWATDPTLTLFVIWDNNGVWESWEPLQKQGGCTSSYGYFPSAPYDTATGEPMGLGPYFDVLPSSPVCSSKNGVKEIASGTTNSGNVGEGWSWPIGSIPTYNAFVNDNNCTSTNGCTQKTNVQNSIPANTMQTPIWPVSSLPSVCSSTPGYFSISFSGGPQICVHMTNALLGIQRDASLAGHPRLTFLDEAYNWTTYEYSPSGQTANGDNGHNLFHVYNTDCRSVVNHVTWINTNGVYNENTQGKFPCAKTGTVEGCTQTTDIISVPAFASCNSLLPLPNYPGYYAGVCQNDPQC